MADATTPAAPVAATIDPAAPAATPERPSWLPEKFSSAEKLAAAYVELEKKMGAGAVPPAAKPSADATVAPSTPEQAVAAGVDLNALGKEYVANGNKLTDASLDALKAKGISADVVSTYVKGAEQQAAVIVSDIAAVAGGEDKLKQVLEWAKSNLLAPEIAAYNKILDAGDRLASKLAFEGLHSRFRNATGSEPTRTTGAAVSTTSGPAPFASKAEMVAAMRDPRYKSDPGYRDTVAKRLAAAS